MKHFNYFKSLMMTALLLVVGGGLAGCVENNDELLGEMPEMTLSAKSLSFTQEPDEAQSFRVELTGAGAWEVKVADSAYADQVEISPASGTRSSDVYVKPSATLTPRQIDLTVTLMGEIVGRLVTIETQTVTIYQTADGGSVEVETVYANNFDKTKVSENTDFSATSDVYRNETGSGIADVTYAATGRLSFRTSKNASSSGNNIVFFGAAPTTFTIGNIALPSNKLTLAFELSRSTTEYVSVSDEELAVTLSADGENWSAPLKYNHSTEAGWVKATKDFTLPEGTKTLYIRFTCSVSSEYRMDDVVLSTGIGGTNVTFDGKSDDNGGDNGDDEPGEVPGANTPENPLTVAEAIAVAKAAGTTATKEWYYIKGKVSNVKEQFSTQYGNATLELKDDGANDIFTAFRIKYFGNKAWAEGDKTVNVGDEVIVYGQIVNYMGNTPETNSGNGYLYMLNGEGGDQGEQPEQPTPGEGKYISDSNFVYSNAGTGESCLDLGTTTVNGEAASGVKIGTSSAKGSYTSGAVGVEGDHTLSFYAVAWNNAAGTVKVTVKGGGSVSGTDTFELNKGAGVSGNPAFTITGVTENDHYKVALTGLTKTSTVTFETQDNAYRAVLFGIKFGNGDGGNTEPDEPDQPEQPEQPASVTIDQITAAGTYNVAEATVVAAGSQAYIIADATGAIMVYNTGHSQKVGEKIAINGDVTIYNATSTPQFNNTAQVTVLSSNNAWEYKPATVAGTTFDALAQNIKCQEVQFDGKLSISGNYLNVDVDGASCKGSLKYVAAANYSELNGKNITVKGYMVGTSTSSGTVYINVLPYSVTANGTTEPEPEPEQPEVSGNKVVFSEMFSETTDVTTVKFNAGTITFDKADGSNAPKYYSTGTPAVRMYAKNTVTFDAGNKKITGIKFSWGATTTAGLTPDSGELKDNEWNGSAQKVTFTVGATGQQHITAVEITLEGEGGGSTDQSVEPTPSGKYTLVQKFEDLKAGKYYMAGFSDSYNSTTFKPYSHHVWTGTLASGDCVTCGYEFDENNGELVKNPTATTAAAEIELVAVSGKENTYYIVYNGNYLSTSDYTNNRKLQLGETKGEWTVSEHSKGGILLTTSNGTNSIILGTAAAASNMLRSYKSPAASLTYGVCFFKK